MPFLIPAMVALPADFLVLWLNRLSTSVVVSPDDWHNSDDDEAPTNYAYVYRVEYLAPCALLRVILLLLPLLFHSYTGTALRYPLFYQLLYWGTLLCVLVHMVLLSLVNPSSLEAIVPVDIGLFHSSGGDGYDADAARYHGNRQRRDDEAGGDDGGRFLLLAFQSLRRLLLNQEHEYRRIWWMLIATTVSTVCHLFMLWHVRSTAPAVDYMRSVKQPTVYFALRSASMADPSAAADAAAAAASASSLPTQIRTSSAGAGPNGAGPEPALVHAMSEFVVEVQSRLNRAKAEWTARLEDFTNRVEHSTVVRRAGPNNPLQPQTPFGVLLQLFAYEDVLENGRLSQVFDQDGGAAFIFFVPQLITFLLHGALYCSPELEKWVLERCGQNIYFAHRCYWFLRAWCLEVPADHPVGGIMSRNNSEGHLSIASGGALQAYLDEPASPGETRSGTASSCGGGTRLSAATAAAPGTGGAPTSAPKHNNNAVRPDKLYPEERALIERLMMRVKECGEGPARLLEFGSGELDEDMNVHHGSSPLSALSSTDSAEQRGVGVGVGTSPSELMSAVESGSIPIDPVTGYPSVRHMDSVSCQQKYGFMPINLTQTSRNQAYLTAQNNLHLQATSHAPESFPVTPKCGLNETEQFDKAPQFLDALVYLAESLFRVPRAQRKEELHKQLRALECELLPCNSIYLPMQHSNHRVWRIVADESIPISTKERVPCIICLEVIDFAPRLSSIGKRQKSWGFLSRLPRAAGRPFRTTSTHSSSISNDSAHQTQQTSSLVGQQQQPDNSASPFAVTAAISPKMGRSLGASSFDSVLPPQQEPLPPSTTSPVVGFDATATAAATESDMVREWRYARRDPLRRSSLIDKMTTTVRDSMKVPLDKMTSQMMNQFRDRTSGYLGEELQSLTMLAEDRAAAMMEEDSAPQDLSEVSTEAVESPANGHGRSKTCNLDVEKGLDCSSSSGFDQQQQNDSSDSSPIHLARIGSAGSLVSMGQWSSPQPHKEITMPPAQGGCAAPSLPNIRKRGSREQPQDVNSSENGNGSCPYGSDHEEESGQKVSAVASSRPPKPPTSKANKKAKRARRRRSGGTTSAASQMSSSTAGTASSATTTARKPPVVFLESWQAKQERIRERSAYGGHPGWRLLPILVKANDDLRQEQLASQIIYRMASILARERVPVWLCPYEIIALTDRAGILEAIPDTISLDSLKKNDHSFTSLRGFFHSHYGEGTDELADAKANFVESLAAYSVVCFLLQLKDRHNGNILLDNRGHLIHIDFGFFFLSSPGKNAGFESAPFKLTREFVEVLDGPESRLFRTFRELYIRAFIVLRRHCMEIILLVEMLKNGNEELPCFRGKPDEAVRQLRERFRLDLNDRACREYVNSLIDDSIENWRTDWYDRYQRYFVGVL